MYIERYAHEIVREEGTQLLGLTTQVTIFFF